MESPPLQQKTEAKAATSAAPGEAAQLVKGLSYSIPRIHVLNPGGVLTLIIAAQGRQGQEDPWNAVPTQPKLISKPQANKRPCTTRRQ